jgi:prepilin-type N-terminal cleavage/methylation domain-containing protein/prepilin-type processing-associated H-X9-DG protein
MGWMLKWVIMKNSGFTLVELLVVIAVIALLMAISVPSLQGSRQQARAVLCGSNVKQLALSLIMYETHNGTLPYGFDNTRLDPPPGGWKGNPAYDRIGWWWLNYIGDDSKKPHAKGTVYWCPARQTNDLELKNRVLCGNYGVNQSICKNSRGSRKGFVGTPLSTTYVLHPDQTLLVVDCGYSLISWWHATDSAPVALGTARADAASYVPGLRVNEERQMQIWKGLKHDALDGRHPNRTVNVGFADGHAKRAKADDLFVEKTDDGYRNQSPLWVPK